MFASATYMGFQQERGTQPLTWVTTFTWEPAISPSSSAFLGSLLRPCNTDKSHVYKFEATSTAPSHAAPPTQRQQDLEMQKGQGPLSLVMWQIQEKMSSYMETKRCLSPALFSCALLSHSQPLTLLQQRGTWVAGTWPSHTGSITFPWTKGWSHLSHHKYIWEPSCLTLVSPWNCLEQVVF